MQPTETEWEVIASKTVKRWQYPKGKHISFVHPKDSGFDFCYYKLFFSIVLSALVDYDYKLIHVDVGCLGRISDVGVYRNSSLCKVLSKGTLNLPRPRPPPNVE